MGIDTYLVIPARSAVRAASLLADGGDEVTHVGADFVVVYKSDLFAAVERDTETWGPRYAEDLPRSLRRGLDPRGLLALPEVGQSFGAKTYREAVDSEGPSVWLPLRRVRRRRMERLLLVALSPAREALLLESPELVRELISSRASVSIPGLIEFDEIWIDLQRLLLDCLWLERSDDCRADALAPRSGLTFLEDADVDAARLVRADAARATADWLLSLTPAVIERAQREPPSPAARRFPESLGAAAADDREPLRAAGGQGNERVTGTPLSEPLKRLLTFYADVRRTGRSVLSIRFRE